MFERKMFSLDFIDESVSRLNIQPCDGDRPSCLRGISLQSSDSNSNLHQHGWQLVCVCTQLSISCLYSYANVDSREVFTSTDWSFG